MQKDFDRENTVGMRGIEMDGVKMKLDPLHLEVKEVMYAEELSGCWSKLK